MTFFAPAPSIPVKRHYFPTFQNYPLLSHWDIGEEHRQDFGRWIEAHNPDVVVGFGESHYYFLSHLKRQNPFGYTSLHQKSATRISGVSADVERCAIEAVNLLHFCRRTYQWGIPEKRIDHVIEPTWLEGDSLPDLTDIRSPK